ncbi:T9SS type A sorting domain-containing protein [uncultured Aquimarina sp.]|uniref:glycosyl hydrolase family 28-related protein n=1 Tax=uncultured Aquimarina sp. TaxID=575652 RepID=UPI0026132201|nr:T9SS type A sorting domain-containing protein [uncultured Aquimarina sp.]
MKEKQTIIKNLFLITLFIFSQITIAQEDIRFPEGAGVIDVTKLPYNVVPNDGLDDTEKLQRALDDHPNGNFIIYLPNGIYNISNRLKWPESGFALTDFQYVIMEGQSKEGTILQLNNNAPNYQDPDSPRPLILTSESFAEGANSGSNVRFRNSVRNLTIHTGVGNPGAVGLQFKANNTGGAKNLIIKSGDGQGVIGLDFTFINDNGPLLIKNIEIIGFDYGIKTNFNGLSLTFENIILHNQNVYGFFNSQQVIAVRNLVSYNEVPAFFQTNQGTYTTLIDCELNGIGNASNSSAIIFGKPSGLFVRNVSTIGYKTAITELLSGTTPLVRVAGPNIYEYSSEDVLHACNNLEKSLNLNILDPPIIARGDINKDWVNIQDFGATIDTNQGDDSKAIQAALNSGASTIYVPTPGQFPRSFNMNTDVIVPQSVKRIIGLEGRINGAGRFIIEGGTDPIVIERFQGLASGIFHNSERTLIMKDLEILYESAPSGAGDVFIENIAGGGPNGSPWVFNNQKVWARQFNVELLDVNVINNGGDLWILGMKTEHRSQIIKTINGGRSELLGALHLITDESSNLPAYEVIDGSLSVAGARETSFSGFRFPLVVRDIRNGVVQDLLSVDTPAGLNGFGLPLYVSYIPKNQENKAPQVEVIDDLSTLIENNEVDISGEVNDDGLPNSNCSIATTWSKFSGPGEVTFSNASDISTKATFQKSGAYKLLLSGNDGELVSTDTLRVNIFDKAITTAIGNGADSYISGPAGGVNNNFGASEDLFVSNNPIGFSSKIYLKFDLSSLSGQNIELAELAIELSTTLIGVIDPFTYRVYGLNEVLDYGDGKLDENWLEGNKNNTLGEAREITFSNAPANNNNGATANQLTTFLGEFQLRARQREVNRLSSEALTDFIKADNNGVVTLIIERVEITQNSLKFSSKENTAFSPPTLNIAVESEIEEPSIEDYTPPKTVVPGESYIVNIPYTGAGPADIQISLQNRDENWSTEGYAKTSITSSGIATLNLTVKPDAALGSNYHWQAYITPVGGNWSNRYNNKLIDGISCVINRTSNIFQVSDQTIKLYPNPVTDELILQLANSLKEIQSIRIYDLQGGVAKEISKDELKDGTEKSIDVSGITDGMYILSIDFIKKETQNSQFIIKH